MFYDICPTFGFLPLEERFLSKLVAKYVGLYGFCASFVKAYETA